MEFFSLTFHFSVCMSCLFPGHPVIFTSCYLYFPHVIEYLLLLIWKKQRKQPILIDGKNIFTYSFQPNNAYNLILQLMV